MSHLTYEESKKLVLKGLIILAVVTLVEVFIALYGKGHILGGSLPTWFMYIAMISLSMYKAYFIIGEFMHMKYEVRGLAFSVILPTALLLWAIFAFLQEGNSWGERRTNVNERDAGEYEKKPVGDLLIYELESIKL